MFGMRDGNRFYGFFYRPRNIGRHGRAFTLLELLAVVATIVIFSSILMTSNQNAINQANVNLQAQQEIQLKEALDMWVLNQGLASAKKAWEDDIKNDPAKILEVAKTMLAPSTRGVFRLNKDGIVSDASINTGDFFDVTWNLGAANDVVFDGPVVNPVAVPVPSAANPAPSAGPGSSPAASPGAPTPTASPDSGSSPTASPGASPPATASPTPTPEPVTVSPYLQESSLSLLLYPRAVAPNSVADLKVVAENPAGVPLTYILSGVFPNGLQIQSWDSLVKADATLNEGTFYWKGQLPANGSVDLNFKLISPVIADYTITFRLEANVADNAVLAGDGFQNVDTALLKVMADPPAPGNIWDFAATLPTPSPAVKGLPITLGVEPVYIYDPAVREVFMSLVVPSNLFFLGFADASGASYLGQNVLGDTRTLRFFLGRGDRDLSGVRPKLIFSSNDVGVAQTIGSLGRTSAANEYSEQLNSLTWVAAPTPSPTPQLSKFELREFAKGPRPAPFPVVIVPGQNGSLLLAFRNNNTVPVGYRVEVTATSAILLDGATITTATSSTLVMTGTAPARDVVDLSSRLTFFSLTDNPSFTVKIFRTGEAVPDLQPPELPALNWKD